MQDQMLELCLKRHELYRLENIHEILGLPERPIALDDDTSTDTPLNNVNEVCKDLAKRFRENHGGKADILELFEILEQDSRTKDIAATYVKWYSSEMSRRLVIT
ncbi:uncharacterized protein LOC102801187 [Saccoglossus kowalevskii]|uniref:Uncharacterized protein LOC102801187 n=1 Tax=Saccoglossus kowalevskii TaxID=10224 RepID=A0ABM0MZ49_SACKO|nr:PREDICTED: uncharacterized protein LOC102801187 [Saccoglossus kowalevskii]